MTFALWFLAGLLAGGFVGALVGYFAHDVTSLWSLQSAYESGLQGRSRCYEGEGTMTGPSPDDDNADPHDVCLAADVPDHCYEGATP